MLDTGHWILGPTFLANVCLFGSSAEWGPCKKDAPTQYTQVLVAMLQFAAELSVTLFMPALTGDTGTGTRSRLMRMEWWTERSSTGPCYEA